MKTKVIGPIKVNYYCGAYVARCVGKKASSTFNERNAVDNVAAKVMGGHLYHINHTGVGEYELVQELI